MIILKMRCGTWQRCGVARSAAGRDPQLPVSGVNVAVMTILDLIKATVICGASAYLIYSFPLVGQVVLIGLLSLLWLGYARKTIASLRRR
jgi:hypothetical protein